LGGEESPGYCPILSAIPRLVAIDSLSVTPPTSLVVAGKNLPAKINVLWCILLLILDGPIKRLDTLLNLHHILHAAFCLTPLIPPRQSSGTVTTTSHYLFASLF